ncbi:hypothetical protein LTR78_005239 [Recurvomyces mirabilis]|uniref:Mitochondrial outer membrane transport complex Sam37/metaxin N-terminal domain-containing protein n=1 Tax=Recurvomyces mirabilis TaxID=574656 RepID=A0AAE1C1T6_9PEZI|nr:hypothetical protein LTR78_005239 [Recurvomyces mirabilis]KAK5157789.1 hypothetical protein LTS14_003711 [Recurvomyces mirabilis]
MQLYVLGPAFDLPSIDAGCIAAVTLLRLNSVGDWQLIPTHDDREGLPLLVDNSKRYRGYASIANHLKGTRPTADDTALASFLHSSAQTLLDISLYVSYENYTATRSAFTKILPWHTNYLLPPRRRAAARQRTEHLGVSSIDVDDVHEDLSNRPSGFDGVGKEGQGFEVEAQKRASLLLPRKDTLKSLLQRPEHSAVFKLHALADNFFGALQDMLGAKQYLHGEDISGIDCLAFGYLSLMLYPQLSQDWLAKTMRKKYSKVVDYVERIHAKLELRTNAEEVMSLAQCKIEEEVAAQRNACGMTLPWCAPASSGIADVLLNTSQELLSHVPVLRPTMPLIRNSKYHVAVWQRYLPAILTLAASSVGLGVYLAVRTGMLTWPHGEQVHVFGRKRFSDYGHLGAALSGLIVLNQQVAGDKAYHAQEQFDDPVHVDVAVVGDDG